MGTRPVKNYIHKNRLEFEWNTDVSYTVTSGGVCILGFQSDQLKGVYIESGHNMHKC